MTGWNIKTSVKKSSDFAFQVYKKFKLFSIGVILFLIGWEILYKNNNNKKNLEKSHWEQHRFL